MVTDTPVDFVIAALVIFDAAASNLSIGPQYNVPVLIGKFVRPYASGLSELDFLFLRGEIG